MYAKIAEGKRLDDLISLFLGSQEHPALRCGEDQGIYLHGVPEMECLQYDRWSSLFYHMVFATLSYLWSYPTENSSAFGRSTFKDCLPPLLTWFPSEFFDSEHIAAFSIEGLVNYEIPPDHIRQFLDELLVPPADLSLIVLRNP